MLKLRYGNGLYSHMYINFLFMVSGDLRYICAPKDVGVNISVVLNGAFTAHGMPARIRRRVDTL